MEAVLDFPTRRPMKESPLSVGGYYVVYRPSSYPETMMFTGRTSAVTYRSRDNEILKTVFYEMRCGDDIHMLPGWMLVSAVH